MGSEQFFEGVYDDGFSSRSHYAEWATRYDEAVADQGYAQPRRAAEMLERYLPERAGPILDVGCGTGLSGLALREAGWTHIDGCDHSPEMLDVASATGAYERLFPTDLNEPPIDVADGVYDAATVVGVFSFGHVDAAANDEILRTIRPGGVLIIAMNDHYYEESSVPKKLEALDAAGIIELKAARRPCSMWPPRPVAYERLFPTDLNEPPIDVADGVYDAGHRGGRLLVRARRRGGQRRDPPHHPTGRRAHHRHERSHTTKKAPSPRSWRHSTRRGSSS